jgi:uncharacterized metal-binding protein YceD (DUF177 family)
MDNIDDFQGFMPEWSYPFDEDRVHEEVVRVEISPAASEISALCQRLHLVSIDHLKAVFELQRHKGSMVVHVSGHLTGVVIQKCAVTLEPLPERVDERFEAWYADQSRAVSFTKARRDRLTEKDKDEQPVLDEHDDPEPIVDGKIDLGELATQYLSLSLNPFPRAEGVDYENKEPEMADKTSDLFKNPFAALKDWKSKEG